METNPEVPHFAPALLFFVILPQGCRLNFINNYTGSKSIYKPGFLPLIRYLALPSRCSVAPAFYERLLNLVYLLPRTQIRRWGFIERAAVAILSHRVFR